MQSPLPWLLLVLLIAAAGAWSTDRSALEQARVQLEATVFTRSLALPRDRVVQVTLLGDQHPCAQLTWKYGTWLTILRDDGQIEDRPGNNAWHFRIQLRKQIDEHPQCPIQQWVIYGRFTPQSDGLFIKQ